MCDTNCDPDQIDLPDPVQRRRDPRDQADPRQDRRRRDRGPRRSRVRRRRRRPRRRVRRGPRSRRRSHRARFSASPDEVRRAGAGEQSVTVISAARPQAARRPHSKTQPPQERNARGNHYSDDQSAPRADGRRRHGLQARARRGRAATSTKAEDILREKGVAAADEARRPRDPQRRRRELHPRRRPHRRARRGQLRDGLRRAHRRLPAARARHRDAGRRHEPDASIAPRRTASRTKPKARDEESLPAEPAVHPRRSNAPSATWSKDAIAKTGENIRVRRFARFELGR